MSHNDSHIFRVMLQQRRKAWLVIENMRALSLLPYPPMPVLPMDPPRRRGLPLPSKYPSYEEVEKSAARRAQEIVSREEDEMTNHMLALSQSRKQELASKNKL